MAVSLADLVTELQGLVPAQDSTPSTAQYQKAVKDAVHAFNDKAGRKKLHTMSVVSNDATYTLPDDFLKVISWEPLTGMVHNGVIIGETGIIPMNDPRSFSEKYTIAGLTLTIHPTPTYNTSRYLWYKAGFVLDDDEIYQDMTQREASIIIEKAQGNAWRVVGGRTARGGWKYQIGDVMIDKSNLNNALAGWISGYDKEFEDRIKAYIGTVGLLA